MFELKVLKETKYRNFDKIKSIKRYNKELNEHGKLYVNDIITVETDDEVRYLCGENQLKLVVCEIIAGETTSTPKETTKQKEKKTTKKKGDK